MVLGQHSAYQNHSGANFWCSCIYRQYWKLETHLTPRKMILSALLSRKVPPFSKNFQKAAHSFHHGISLLKHFHWPSMTSFKLISAFYIPAAINPSHFTSRQAIFPILSPTTDTHRLRCFLTILDHFTSLFYLCT